MTENELATIIVHASYKIHTKLGPGLLESVYEKILHYELTKRGLIVSSQMPIEVIWEDVNMDFELIL